MWRFISTPPYVLIKHGHNYYRPSIFICDNFGIIYGEGKSGKNFGKKKYI